MHYSKSLGIWHAIFLSMEAKSVCLIIYIASQYVKLVR